MGKGLRDRVGDRGAEGDEKRIKMHYVPVLISHSEYYHYALQTCANKKCKKRTSRKNKRKCDHRALINSTRQKNYLVVIEWVGIIYCF